ncbi:MAG: PDC sensor domain-containing protein [Desulfomonilaceae bacterium]
MSVARRIEQDFRAAAKVPEALVAVLETVNPNKESLLPLIRWMVENGREVYGVAVAFEPYSFEKSLRWFAPYYYKDKSTVSYKQLGSESYDYFTKDWYHLPEVLRGPVWTEPYFDEGAGGILMTTCSRPFFSNGSEVADRKFRGVVSTNVSLEWPTKIVSSVQPGRSGYCFIISDTGRFVTHPDSKMIMSESIFSLAEQRHDPNLRDLGMATLNHQTGFVSSGSSLGGEAAFLAYARIPSPGWSLGVIFPKKELLAEMNSLHESTLLLAIGGLALLIAVSGLVARSIARPLR